MSPTPVTQSLPLEVAESDDEIVIITRSTWEMSEKVKKWCLGLYLEMPPGVLPYSAYPFMLHEVYTLPWNIHIVGHRMSLQSTKCIKEIQGQHSESCHECMRLLTHQIVEGILDRIRDGIHANTAYMYQPIGGLVELLRKKTAMVDGMRFKQLSTSRTMATRARTVGQYEQLIMAMSEGSVNRLDALLRAGINRGVGVRGMMELLDRAQKGLYKPKNFTEEEMSCGLLFLRLGGARVASLAHQALGSPGLSTLRRASIVTPLLPSAGTPSLREIQRNLQAAFKNSQGEAGCGYVLMIDEIKVEERMRWDPASNKILGLCREHTQHVGLDFCSVNDAKVLIEGILRGEIHHASEVSHSYCISYHC
jgi:hypothetical protein